MVFYCGHPAVTETESSSSHALSILGAKQTRQSRPAGIPALPPCVPGMSSVKTGQCFREDDVNCDVAAPVRSLGKPPPSPFPPERPEGTGPWWSVPSTSLPASCLPTNTSFYITGLPGIGVPTAPKGQAHHLIQKLLMST